MFCEDTSAGMFMMMNCALASKYSEDEDTLRLSANYVDSLLGLK